MLKEYVIPDQSDGHNIGYRVELCDGPISVCYGPVFDTEDDAWRFHSYCMIHFEGIIENWFANCYAGIKPEFELDLIQPRW